MFTKNSLASISGFLNLALVPLRSATLIRGFVFWRGPQETRIVLLRDGEAGAPDRELVFQGNPQAGPQRIEAALARGERVALEGIPFEAITTLCKRHNYRWRLHPDRKPEPHFVLEPAPTPAEEPAARH